MLLVVLWVGAQFTVYRNEPYLIPMDDVDVDSDARQISEEVWEDDEEDNPNRSLLDKFWDSII
jgi:amino acid transporter